ncbi:MAG TPA: RNA polymerase subunit sigma-70, partial [Solirubrobacteraceae bacterium]
MTSTRMGSVPDAELVAAASAGDQEAFAAVVEPYRGQLHAHCYRMLGSLFDADDALQETLLRAWRGLARFHGRSALRSWLYSIATNVCLTQLARRSKRVLPLDYGPATDPYVQPGQPIVESVLLEPYPDEALGLEDGFAAPEARYEQRESVELAFIAALQLLPARQRAVLILRDVLGFSGDEVADALETTPASVYSALQRAHRTVDERLPAQSQQAALRALDDAQLRALVDGYTDAWQRADVDALVALLTEDAVMSMPPHTIWFRGRDAIASFLSRWP